MNKIQHGLNPLPHDHRDLNTGAVFQLPKLEEIPDSFFTEPLTIKDQNADLNFDFCAGAAGAGLSEPREEVELFYPFLWAAAKYESGADIHSFGVDLRSVGKAICKWGIPEVKDVPDSVKNLTPDQRRDFANYPQSVRDAAKKHQAQTYMFVNGPYDDFDNARANLYKFRDEKRQILFGVMWSWNDAPFELTGTKGGGGHAMWLSGAYDKDWLQCTNSIGKTAGVMGQHKISRETYNKFASIYGALIIVDKPKDEIQYYVDNKIKAEDNWLSQFFKIAWTIIASAWLTTKEKALTLRKSADELNKVADMIDPKTPVIEPVPVPKPVPPVALLDVMCLAIQSREGWIGPCAKYPQGTTAFRNNNPGNLKYAGQYGSTGKDSRGFAIFPTYQAGYDALKRQILLIANDKSNVYPKQCTLAMFFGVYAPSYDNNNPASYAKEVATKMGVSVDWKLSTLIK